MATTMSLFHSPSDVLRTLLINLGVGTNISDGFPWPIICGREPDRPDSCVTTYDTSGKNHGLSQINGERQEHHGFQVRIRASIHESGHQKAEEIKESLAVRVYDDYVRIDNSLYLVHSIARISVIRYIGKEQTPTKRSLFTVNGLISMKGIRE